MTFANPEWLLLLIPLPFLAIFAAVSWHHRSERWHDMLADRHRDRLSHQRPVWIYFTSLGLALFGLAGLIVAYAQPESGEEWIETKNEGRNILLCVDISRSMLTKDVSPNRLMAARAAALEVVEQFPRDRIGMMIFSGQALVQVPLTIDHTFVEQSLAQLNPIDLPIGGSNLTDALHEGTRVLVNTGQRSNILVIFSDGEEFSPGLEEAAQTAADSGIFVYALGFGTKAGDFIPGDTPDQEYFYDRNNNRVQSRLNEDSLTMIAKTSDGFYSRGIGPTFLRKLDTAMQEMDRFEEEGKHRRVAKPAYQWFLFAGILLLMSSLTLRCFPLRSTTAAILAFLFLPTPASEANPLVNGRIALRNGDAMRAHSLFTEAAEDNSGDRAAQMHLAAGSAAFQAQGWSSAADSFSQALVSSDSSVKQEAHYALATSLFYMGIKQSKQAKIKAWKGSIEHYEQALEIDPDDERSRVNLETVRKYLDEILPKDDPKQSSTSAIPPRDDDNKNQESGSNDPKEEKENSQSEEPGGGGKPKENPEDQSRKSEAPKEADNEKQDDQRKESGTGNDEDPNENNRKDNVKPNESENSEEPKENKGNPSSKPLKESSGPEGESKEDRARRLLRQHADFGGKPPKHGPTPSRRPEKDW